MAGHPYKASKAWYYGHSLAIDAHKLAKYLADIGETKLSVQIRKSSSTIPLQIAASHERSLPQEKVACYKQARTAASELQAHLLLTRDMRHISHKLHTDLSGRASTAYLLLNELIQKTTSESKRSLSTD